MGILKRKYILLAGLIVYGLTVYSFEKTGKNGAIEITVINYHGISVHGAVVRLEAEDVYKSFTTAKRGPLTAVDEEGRVIPLEPVSENNKLYFLIYVGVGPQSVKHIYLIPSEDWWSGKVRQASWDKTKQTGFIRNGLLKIVIPAKNSKGKKRISVALDCEENAAVVVPELYYMAWPASQNWQVDRGSGAGMDGVPERLGYSSIDFSDDTIAGANAVMENGSPVLHILRRGSANGVSLEYSETYKLYPGTCIFDMIMEFKNPGVERVFLAGEVKGRLSDVLWRPDSMVRYIPRESHGNVVTVKADMGKPGNAQILGLINPGQNRYGLGCMFLGSSYGCEPLYPVFGFAPRSFILRPHRKEPGIRDYGPQLSAPIPVEPGDTLKLEYRFAVTGPGIDAYDTISSLKSEQMTFHDEPSLLTVFACGRVVDVQHVKIIDADDISAVMYTPDGELEKRGNTVRLQTSGRSAEALYAANMDFSRKPQLLLDIAGLAPDARLEIFVRSAEEKSDTVPVLKINKPGSYVVDLAGKLKSSGESVDFVVTEKIIGGSGVWVDFRCNSIATRPLDAPRLLWPREGDDCTDIAVFFDWEKKSEMAESKSWIQISRNLAFDVITEEGPARPWADRWKYCPEKVPEPGCWYWRVRIYDELGRPGNWSEPRMFTVNNIHKEMDPVRPIDSDHPLFFHEVWRANDMEDFKNVVPEDLRDSTALTVMQMPKKGVEATVQTLNKYGINTLVGYNPSYDFSSLSEIEYIFKNCPTALGVHGGEYAYTFVPAYSGKGWEWAELTKRCLQLCAKYGRYFMWCDGQCIKFRTLHIGADPEMRDWWKRYSKYILFGPKSNIVDFQYLTQGAYMGLWIDGFCRNMAMWDESFYWDHAGFNEWLTGNKGRKREGKFYMQPPIWRNMEFILGMTQGYTAFGAQGQWSATIAEYDPERGGDAYYEGFFGQDCHVYQAFWDYNGRVTPVYHEYMVPLQRAIVIKKMIPTRDEVISAIRMAVTQKNRPEDIRHNDKWGKWAPLYQGTYGFAWDDLSVIKEMIPNTGRYGFIPILPYGIKSFPEIKTINVENIDTVGKVKAIFDPLCPSWYTGDAWCVLLDEKFYILNSWENKDATQFYEIPFKDGAIHSMSGRIEPHSYVIGRREKGGSGLWLQANTQYRERETKLLFKCGKEPASVVVTPGQALVERQWNVQDGCLKLRLSHFAGAVECEIKE